MINKSNGTEQNAPIVEDFKNSSFGLNKSDPELYNDEDNIVLPVVRVKHVNLPNKGDRWKIMSNNVVVFVLEGAKLSKKERSFLHTIDGVSFLLRQAKEGIKSFHQLHTALKKLIKSSVSKKAKKPQK